MTLDKLVESDILCTCNALGSEVRGVYEKDQHCVESLKDLLRYLKKDNDDHSILCFLGSVRLLQNDLLPLTKRYSKDSEIFDFALRILIALTNPALILFNEDIPEDKLARNTYLQIVSYLQSYKKAFIDIDIWKTLYEHLKDLLKIRPIDRSSTETMFIERILILIRNVLHVPADEAVSKQTGDDDSTHDKIIKCLNESKIDVLLLYICANEEEHNYCLHVLEVISLMLREHTTETLAKANETRSVAEKDEDLRALLAARQREQKLKAQKIQSLCTSRFNGVYCVKNMKSLSDNDYISHKLITNPEDVRFDINKDYRRKPKNKARAPDIDNTRQSTLRVRLLLKKFCIEFLKSYNKVMVSVKRELLRKVDDHDDSYYLWAVSYFMQFNRVYDFQSALVDETISVQSFHHIQTQITNYHEMMLTDKKKTRVWARRMQLGVSAYKELLETLKMMERSKDETVREKADKLISHVFYVIEYRELLLSLLSNFDEVKFSLSYLAELVESTQLFLKMLENHSKRHSEIIVQKKQRKHKKKKKQKVSVPDEVPTEDQLNEQWNDLLDEISEAIQQKRPVSDVTPFDCASEMTFEEQKVEAVYKIRDALINYKAVEAVDLLRASRELWPEGDSFGAADIDPDSELNVIKEIYFSGLQKDPPEKKTEVEERDDDDDEENEEIESRTSFSEQKLDTDDVYKRYANHKVVYPCSMLFANYQNNKPQTNLCLIKLFHRIAWNCKMHGLFFQSSIFLTFQKIFHDPDVNCNPIMKEFYRFARYIMQMFFIAAQKNEKMFVELLFWKGPREAFEIEEGYGTSEVKGKLLWTEEEDEELKYLFEENKNIYIEGQDVADIILANLNSGKRTKVQVRAALKRLGLIKSATDLRPEKRNEWLESEIVELQDLFEDYKNSENVMGNILDGLSIKRGRKAVTEKLIELNLITDKKEMRKKTKKGTRKSKDSNLSDNEGSNEDSDENDYASNHNINSGDSSGEEAEINFFKNLDAERHVAENDSFNDENPPPTYETFSNAEPSKKLKNKVIWEEKEILELANLFNENSESEDKLDIILNSLSTKRSKEVVIKKLLELGLIKNKKEILKKNKQKILNKSLKDSAAEDSESDPDAPIYKKPIGKSKEKKKLKRHILSDSDEDIHNSTLKDLNKSQAKSKQPKAWNEEEVVQLNQLFIEHKDDDDVLSKILCNLSIKRTKKSVVEKMLEIGLIKTKSDLQKKTISKTNTSKQDTSKIFKKNMNKKSTDMWEESELIELNQLYQNNKDSNDIITDILKGLTFKRNKKDVVEKMLEIGLIRDKKEIRKKRISKKAKDKENLNKMTDSDNEGYQSFTGENKTVKNVSLVSSDDDDIPLISVSSTNSLKKDIDSSALPFEISTMEKTISSEIATRKEHVTVDSELPELNIEQSASPIALPAHNKRKRLLIDSDSDEDSSSFVDKNYSESLRESSSIADQPENHTNESLFKPPKKKICVLEDSDDSS